MKLLIICGPTATGKTSLAIALAKTFHGELVSADSRQVYKGLDALTGKERSDDIPVRLYDVAEKEFSAAHFVRLARPVIDRIAKEGKLPIVVGGTGFYLRALTDPPKTITIPPNWKLREKLANQSVRQLQKLVDPKRLALMNASDRQNPRRLIRAIEVAGREARLPKPRYETLWIGLTAPLPVLRDRIGTRIKKRWRQAAREVRGDLPPILGVAPLLAWLRGENTKDEAIRRWVTEEYQYARRQMTWFRKMADIHWFDVTQAGYTDRIFDLVRSWYT